MKKNSDFSQTLAFLIVFAITILAQVSCLNQSRKNAKTDDVAKAVTDKPTQDEKADAANTSCVDATCPKITVHAGVLNAKVLYNPKPEYPKEAKEAGISGEVKVSIVVNEKGAVACAKILTGHPVLQEAVKKVVCDVRCKPQMISGRPHPVAGFLTYNFVL